MKLGKEILDLLGRRFKVGNWQFITFALAGIPKGYVGCMTRDRHTDIRVNLFIPPKGKDYIMTIYNSKLKVWVQYDLTYLEYIPAQDMRNIKV